METIKRNTINELEKIVSKRGLKIHFSLIALLPILLILLSEKIQKNDMLNMPDISLTFAMLKAFVVVLVPIYSFVTAADLFSAEQEKGTLFSVRPIQRFEIFFSKITALAIMILSQLLLFYSMTALAILLFGEPFSTGDFISLLFSTIISWLPQIAITILAAFIAQFFKSSAASVGVGIFIYVAMFVLPFILPTSLNLFPTSYLDWYQLWNENVSVQWMIGSSIYLFSFSTLFFASGYYMFNRKEV